MIARAVTSLARMVYWGLAGYLAGSAIGFVACALGGGLFALAFLPPSWGHPGGDHNVRLLMLVTHVGGYVGAAASIVDAMRREALGG